MVRFVRLSQYYSPTLRAEAVGHEQVKSVSLLLRGGYVRQSASGLFTLLPNGLRIVRKIERVIDQELGQIGCSRLEMPAVLSSTLWHKTGRFATMGSELYKLNDRKGTELVLGPTYEEEITKLVGDDLQSWKQLPIKLYQITTKYRDEPRPRSGLLRTKAFLMKDLYTFDATLEDAQLTYKDVSTAYERIMTRIFGTHDKQWFKADADTGAMGGTESQEYQVPDELGEDTLLKCDGCGYIANEEKAASLPSRLLAPIDADDVEATLYGASDPASHGSVLTVLLSSKKRRIDPIKLAHALEQRTETAGGGLSTKLFPSDGSGTIEWDWKDRPEGPLVRFDRLRVLVDHECTSLEGEDFHSAVLQAVESYGSPPGSASLSLDRPADAPVLQNYFPAQFPTAEEPIPIDVIDVRQTAEGDTCASCQKGKFHAMKTVEVGHTFLLGKRYGEALDYTIAQRDNADRSTFQMGCYGIGITRILGVLAQQAARRFSQIHRSNDGKAEAAGFAWPSSLAPFRVLIVALGPADQAKTQAVQIITDGVQSERLPSATGQALGLGKGESIYASDIAVDDRKNMTVGARLTEADLVGYPIVIILGKKFSETGEVEVRVREQDTQHTRSVPLSSFEV